MPHRSYASTANYRFGFNGQEMNSDAKGLGNSYTAEYWEYDSRLGRRWNIDPKPSGGISEYSVFENSPIWHNDIKGDSTGPTDKLSKGVKAVTITLGVNGITTFHPQDHQGGTLIFPTYGGAQYYGSTFQGGLDEPNSFIQLQFRIGGEGSNKQVGLNWIKRKIKAFENGYKIEAPTAFEGTFGKTTNINNSANKINIKGNFSIGAGLILGSPTFENDANGVPRGSIINRPPILVSTGDPYSVVGLSASAIYRMDFTLVNHYSLFSAVTLHHMQTFAQATSLGMQPSSGYGSISFAAGVSIAVGR